MEIEDEGATPNDNIGIPQWINGKLNYYNNKKWSLTS